MRLLIFVTHPYEVLCWGIAIGFIVTCCAGALLRFVTRRSTGGNHR